MCNSKLSKEFSLYWYTEVKISCTTPKCMKRWKWWAQRYLRYLENLSDTGGWGTEQWQLVQSLYPVKTLKVIFFTQYDYINVHQCAHQMTRFLFLRELWFSLFISVIRRWCVWGMTLLCMFRNYIHSVSVKARLYFALKILCLLKAGVT